MARKEGFVEVDEMLKEIGVNTMITRTIKESPLVNVIHDEPYSLVFSFDYHGKTYYYKFTDYKEISPYNELIAEELAHDFGIPCVDYDLAVLGDIREGNISKDYKRPDANYLTGQDILYSFYSKTMNFGDSFLDENRYNSLENIWDALEYRYQFHPDKREVIRSLMEKLVNIYLFDVLVCQSDRHSGNWMIEEKENNIDIICPDLFEITENTSKDYKMLYNTFSDFCNNQKEKLNLCGLSLGGILALDFVKEYPEKVNSIILIGTPYNISKKNFITLVNSMSNLNIAKDLETIKCKSLIICGDKDNANMENAKLLNKSIKNSKFKVTSKC